ncbi:MAG: hypothetical protein R2758_09260 [Bacteroidales bacterium]
MFSNGGNLAATGYIDYVEFSARASLTWRGNQLFITDSRSVAPGSITRFTVGGSAALKVWDVTDPFAPLAIQTTTSSGNTVFTAAADSLEKIRGFQYSQPQTAPGEALSRFRTFMQRPLLT